MGLKSHKLEPSIGTVFSTRGPDYCLRAGWMPFLQYTNFFTNYSFFLHNHPVCDFKLAHGPFFAKLCIFYMFPCFFFSDRELSIMHATACILLLCSNFTLWNKLVHDFWMQPHLSTPLARKVKIIGKMWYKWYLAQFAIEFLLLSDVSRDNSALSLVPPALDSPTLPPKHPIKLCSWHFWLFLCL